MTEEIIKNGFWHSDGYNHLKIPTTIFIEDYQPNEKLRLLITQLDYTTTKRELSSTQLKKLVDEWCEMLPTLKEIKYLWLPSRVNQKLFDSICQMENLEGLWIKWSGIKSIDKIIQLKRIKHLHIGSSSQIESIDVLRHMKSLVTLETEQLNKINDFSALENLTQLSGLGIDGSMWTSQKIKDINFVVALSNLKYLTLTNTVMQNKSFDPLLNLKNIVRFNCSWNYPEKEFEKLKQIPSLKYGNVETSWKEVKESR